jgi:phosphonate transport system permease protein
VEAVRAAGANGLQVFALRGPAAGTRRVGRHLDLHVGRGVPGRHHRRFFGAGGMGWYLRESVQRIASQDVAAILLSIIVLVLAAELFSGWLRARIAKGHRVGAQCPSPSP